MNKFKSSNLWIKIRNIIWFLIFVLFSLILWFFLNKQKVDQGYAFFIEFSNANGIKEGTNVRMRGIKIGYIKNIKIELNSILILAYIHSHHILIPRNSIIETNQIGLLNDTIIDIIPLDKLVKKHSDVIDIFSKDCNKFSFICNLDYVEGERGLNYDDLVRAATRISQRFDDPDFFHVFYLFLQNTLELSDDMLHIVADISNLFSILYTLIFSFLKSS